MIRRKTLQIGPLALLAVTVCCLSIAHAKKPTEPPGGGGGGGEVPTDVIYFAMSPDTLQMNSDGSDGA